MQLIVHDYVKNAIKYVVLAPDKFGSGSLILFDMTTLVFYSALMFVVQEIMNFFAMVAAVQSLN